MPKRINASRIKEIGVRNALQLLYDHIDLSSCKIFKNVLYCIVIPCEKGVETLGARVTKSQGWFSGNSLKCTPSLTKKENSTKITQKSLKVSFVFLTVVA